MRRLLDAAGPFYVFAGVMHFIIPKTYERIMPPQLPAPPRARLRERRGGDRRRRRADAPEPEGPALRRATSRPRRWSPSSPPTATWPLKPDKFREVPKAALYARLPIQILFIAWALAAGTSARR